jgi:hypothetical protein
MQRGKDEQMATEDVTDTGTETELSLRDTLDQAFTDASDADETPEKDDTAAEADDRGRDDKGRFAPKAPAQAPAASQDAPAQAAGAQGAAAPAIAAAPAPGDLKAPASWRPEVREKWGALDPVVREEIVRRESEAQRVLQTTAQHRQFVDAFERVMAPYEVFIRQENSNPLQAVQNMMQTAADLRVGTPQHKAQLVAGIVKNFGVDLVMLDAILAGAAPGPGAQQPLHDPRVDQLLAQQQRQQQETQQRQAAELKQNLDAFQAKHEFYSDVAPIMADLVEVRARRGEAVDLEQLYKQACNMHDGVSTIMQQRAAAAKAGQQSAAVLRAKRAAVSVKGDTAPAGGGTVPKNDSIRAHIEAAFDTSSRV